LLLQLNEQKCFYRVNKYPKIESVIRQIKKAPELNWNLQSIAAGCGVSYTHFRRLFKIVSGMPPGDFIITERMNKAARILRQNNPPEIKETAEICGYDDIYYFSKLFKKCHGIPPGRYRDNFQYI
jgi:AraC-like DNA-binding protein